MRRVGPLRRGAVAFTLVVGITAQVEAITIVDTGQPAAAILGGRGVSGTGSGSGVNQWQAGEFNVGTSTKITGALGYMHNYMATPRTATVALYNDGSEVPGSELFSAFFTVPWNPSGTVYDWYGLSSLNWEVGPGTYWLAFEVRSGQTFWGVMPSPSPTPLNNEANFFNGTWNQYDATNIGVRVYGEPVSTVPEPATLLLLGSGLAGIGGAAWRRKKKEAASPDHDDV